MASSELEAAVQTALDSCEPINQDEFVDQLVNDDDVAKSVKQELGGRESLEPSQVLEALRTLMERDQVSYTIDYNLQTQDAD